MTCSRHTEDRNLLNRKRTVVILYQLCFGYSQKCNFFQEDNGLFLSFCNLSQCGIETQRQLGTSVSSKVISRNRAAIARENTSQVNDAIQEAIDKKFTILLMIDDYHNIHTIRRPQDQGTSKVDHMCTIIIKIVKEVPAIPFSSVNLVHNPYGIDIDLLVNKLCSVQFFSQVCTFSFASSMPEFTSVAFDPVMGRHQIEPHDYQGASSCSLRSFKDVYLIDFVKLDLKSKQNYEDAFNIVLDTNMREYLSKFIVLMPADWPGQFFPRQIVYQKASQATTASNFPPGSCRHPLSSVIPTLGPLHVDLNADEDIVVGYMPFMRLVYESVFPGRKLADKPKPWRIQFVLELVYGGWTLIRTVVKSVFSQVKDVQYGILFNLLDNYIPLTLCSYSILFKLNRLDDYYFSVFRLWIMFFCFHRKNYNKAPLFWLSNILFWQTNGCRDVYNFFSGSLSVIDEYFVEFVHSLARKSTNPSDSVDQLQQKLFSIFASGDRQANFRAAFTPSKNYIFSRRQLVNLFSRVASTIVTILSSIANSPGAAHPLPRAPGQRRNLSLWCAPALFGDASIKSDYLPLGFQFQPCPDQGRRCDKSGCTISTNTPWKVFEGCWHSFHLCCLTVVDVCPICREGIVTALTSLANTANQSVRQQQDATATDGPSEGIDNSTGSGGDDDEPLTSTVDGNVDEVVQNLTRQVMSLSVASPPAQPLAPSRANVPSTPSCPSPQRRPPHCSTCGHLKQGHQRPVSQGAVGKCPVCPSQSCTRHGRILPCQCAWCSRQSQTGINPPISSLPQGPVVRETQINPDVTEWLISFSQSTVTPGQMGSNACTIISVYGAVNFLMPSTNWSLPSPHSLPLEFVSMFKQLMIYGNHSYNGIGNPQATYSAPEIINHPQLGFSGVVKCGDEYQFNNFTSFAGELQHLAARPQHSKLAAVIILPPDKTMLLLVGRCGESVLMESHMHGNVGAIIASAGPHKLHEMALYIEFMARRDWAYNSTPFDMTIVELC